MTQHRKPCKTCAFRRDIAPGSTGGSPPSVYIGQAMAGMWMPCHETYEEGVHHKDQHPSRAPQCAGFAIYRKNTGCDNPVSAGLLDLPEDKKLVFESHAEFAAHHYEVPVEAAEWTLEHSWTPKELAGLELTKAKVIMVPK